MDKIDLGGSDRLLAAQITESRTFFLQLKGPWQEKVSLALGGWERCRADYKVVRTRYPYPVIEIIVTGRGSVTLDGHKHRLEAGICFATEPETHCQIETDADAPLEKFFFALAGSGCAQAIKKTGLRATRVRHLAARGEIRDLAETITREARSHGRATQAICAHLTQALLLKIGEEPLPRASAPSRTAASQAQLNFERCRALIDNHAREWKGLSDIAAAAELDASSVCRLFRRFLGVSPHAYLRKRKMTLAAAWLLERGGRVQDAAASVGMDDAFHFSRCFRAVHGVAPSALLNARR
jgi:AraC family transcriptional regulator